MSDTRSMPLTQKGLLLAGIVDALSTLKEHKGSTTKAIINYIQANPLPDMKKRDVTEVAIHKAIKQACDNRILRHNSGRYCIDIEGMSCLANVARYSLAGHKTLTPINLSLMDKVRVATRGKCNVVCQRKRRRCVPRQRRCGRRRRSRRRRRSCRRRRRTCRRRRRRSRRRCGRRRRSRRRRRRSCRRRRRSCRRRRRSCRRRRRSRCRKRGDVEVEESPKRRRRVKDEENDSMASLGTVPSLPTMDAIDDMSDNGSNSTRQTRSGKLVNNMARSFLQKVIKK